VVSYNSLEDILIEIDGSIGGLTAALAEATAAIDTFEHTMNEKMDRAGEESGESLGKGLKRGVKRESGGGLLGGLTGMLGKIFMPAMWTGLITGAGQAVAALAPAVGALALIPAAASTAAFALTTLKEAFHGVGTVLSAGFSDKAGSLQKFNEGLKDLTPAARDAVKALVSLKPEIKSLRETVQQSFFTGLAKDIKDLGHTYLPLLRNEMASTAHGFNAALRDVMGWLKVPDTFNSIKTSLGNMSTAIGYATRALAPFLSGLNDIVEVGSTFLPGLAAGLGGMADRFSAFMAEIAGNGTLHDWIQGGLDVLKLIMPLLKDVWGIIHPIIKALQSTTGGGLGFLGTLLHQLALFFNSAKGMETLTNLFQILSTVFGVLGDALAAALPLLSVLVSLFMPLIPVIKDLAAALTPVVSLLGDALVQVLVGLTPLISQLAGTVGQVLVQALVSLLPAFIQLLPALMQMTLSVLPALIPLIQLTGALFIALMPAIVPLVELLVDILVPVLKLLTPLFALFGSTITAGTGPLTAIVTSVSKFVGWLAKLLDSAKTWSAVGDWFKDLWHTILSALNTAQQWLEALPGRIGNAISALPGLLERGASEAMHRFAYAIGWGIGKIVKELGDLPTQVGHIIGLLWRIAGELWNTGIDALLDYLIKLPARARHILSDLWDTARLLFSKGVSDTVKTVSTLPNRVVDFINKLPVALWGAVKNAGKWLYEAGKDIIRGLIDGLKSQWDSAVNAVKSLGHDMFQGFKDAMGIHSPSTVFALGGSYLVAGLIHGITSNAGAARAAVANLIGFGGGGLGVPAFAAGSAIGGGGGGAIVLHVHTHNYLDGKELHAGLIEPAQRYLARTGTTGLETPRTPGGVRK
jgi:phage-related protein